MYETKKELEESKSELKKAEEEINQTKSDPKQCAQAIIVGGDDRYNQLSEKPNNNKNGEIIDPPVKLSFDSSSHQSFSVYCCHSVDVRSGCSLEGVGYNREGRIPAVENRHQSVLIILCERQQRPPARSCFGGLLWRWHSFHVHKKLRQRYKRREVFLDTGNQEPVALFGGFYHAAAISSKGDVIFINRDSVRNSPSSRIPSFSLPNSEKASSVACCSKSIVVELSGKEIACVSGKHEHCLCASREGRVFGRGSNGQLGLSSRSQNDSYFSN